MNEELSDAILNTKKIIHSRIKDKNDILSSKKFNGYERAYFTTNELIAEYLELVELNSEMNALSVTSSGDHMFNLITKGILNIDTFDINKLTEYLAFGLKTAMIIKYNYEEYINALKILNHKYSDFGETSSIISDLIPLMDKKYRIFWKKILDYSYKIQKRNNTSINIMQILCKDFESINNIQVYNNYLKSQENYNKLKNNLGKTNITFRHADAEYLANEFKNKKYDLILLSNILDYFFTKWGYDWEYNKLELYEDSLKEIIKDEGIIFLFYMFDYDYLYLIKTYGIYNIELIRSSGVSINNLKEENIHKITNPIYNDNSGIILARK